jgi:hypothetical protein
VSLERVPVALALACFALPLGACGGDESEPGEEAGADYREAAASICREHEEAERALAYGTGREEAAAFYRGLVRASEERTRSLRRLEPPEDLREHHDMMVSGFEQQDRVLRREVIPRLAAGADPVKAWERAQVKSARFNTRSDIGAGRMDLDACTYEG